MSGFCLIISGGEYSGLRSVPEADFIIACDCGYRHAVRTGLRPDLVLGDFDSWPEGEKTARAAGIPTMRVPIRKDDTDTMIAAREALERGYRDIAIVCALGGRMDHTISNIQTAAFIVRHGGRARILADDTEITVFTDSSLELPFRGDWSLSVFALSDRCTGVCIRGASYDVEDAELGNDFPIGASNNWVDGPVTISVRSGILAVVCAAYRDGETAHRGNES